MSNLRIRRGSWLVTSALTGGGLLYLFCSFLPNAHAMHALRDEIRSRQQFSAQIPALTKSAMQLQKQLDETKQFVAENRQPLPDAARFSELGSRITHQAELAGVRTIHFAPKTPKDLSELKLVPVDFDSEGSFRQLCQMLAGVEALPERIWVEEMRLTGSEETGKSTQCVLKLTVFTANSEKSD